MIIFSWSCFRKGLLKNVFKCGKFMALSGTPDRQLGIIMDILLHSRLFEPLHENTCLGVSDLV